jgi:hypothetical protein
MCSLLCRSLGSASAFLVSASVVLCGTARSTHDAVGSASVFVTFVCVIFCIAPLVQLLL